MISTATVRERPGASERAGGLAKGHSLTLAVLLTDDAIRIFEEATADGGWLGRAWS